MAGPIRIDNMLGRTVTIRACGKDKWTVRQRHNGHYEHHQAGTWLKIINPGSAREIQIRLIWAEFGAMSTRTFGYQRHRGRYDVVGGTVDATSTRYRLTVPKGESYFGSAPWYTNDDAERFCKRAKGKVETYGTTREGRPLRVLRINEQSKRSFVIIAREHATETAGSFAIESIVRRIERDAKRYADYNFHIIPVANPDGVANGTKHPQDAPIEVSDLHYCGMSAADPTVVALRHYLCDLRPDAVLNFHGYLLSVPEIICYTKRDLLAMADAVFDDNPKDAPAWYLKRQAAERRSMMGHCHAAFGTMVALVELPWAGRTIRAAQSLGLSMFDAAVAALDPRRR